MVALKEQGGRGIIPPRGETALQGIKFVKVRALHTAPDRDLLRSLGRGQAPSLIHDNDVFWDIEFS